MKKINNKISLGGLKSELISIRGQFNYSLHQIEY